MICRVCWAVAFVWACGLSGASAQNVGPNEALGAMASPAFALTAAQRSVIYNAVARQRLHGSASGIAAAVGAAVPPSTLLHSLPEQAAIDDPQAEFLKYAMVDGDVVVVDPIRMRVVDVIHRGERP